MSDYIKREDAIAAILKYAEKPEPGWVTGPYAAAAVTVKSLPAAPVREVVRGKWITSDLDAECVTCSNCKKLKLGNRLAFTTLAFKEWGLNFCPNCGADMRDKEEGGST